MEMRPGYKQTEVGVVPEDWNVYRFGNLCTVLRGGSPRPIQNYITDGADGINWIKIGDVNVGAKYIDATAEKIVPAGVPRSRFVKAGDFLLSNSMSFGRPYILRTEGCIHDGWLVIQGYHAKFDTEYLYYYLSAEAVLAQYTRYAAGSGVLNLNKELVSNISVAAPPLSEQRTISEALADVDSLIGSLDVLINKKLAIKQSAMQQLLTGKIRLPGFSREWETKRLGELTTMASGGTPLSSIAAYYDGDIPWVSISDMTQSGKTLKVTERNLTVLGFSNSAAQMFPAGTILYAMYASLGECCIADIPVCTSQAILGIQVHRGLEANFLYYFLNHLKPMVKTLGQQGTQANLNKGMVQNFQLSLPSSSEQTAIATVLSDMDAEIAALEARRDKTRAIKQGMMQQLLTGRIRLVEPETTA